MNSTELYPELEQELITIIKRSERYESLNSREVTMLFYWIRHREEPVFANINKAVNYGQKPKKKYFRKRKSKKEVNE